jgi:hypothetical protein
MVRREGDGIYFGRRASEERVAAMKSPHPQARKAHLEMANRYDDLATAISEREHVLGRSLNGAA